MKFCYNTSYFSFLNTPIDLDPSDKTDLDFWDCFGRKNPRLITEEIRYQLRLYQLLVKQPNGDPHCLLSWRIVGSGRFNSYLLLMFCCKSHLIETINLFNGLDTGVYCRVIRNGMVRITVPEVCD